MTKSTISLNNRDPNDKDEYSMGIKTKNSNIKLVETTFDSIKSLTYGGAIYIL